MIVVKNVMQHYDEIFKHMELENPIILPTDTNYNLACDPMSKKAIDSIFNIKNRKKEKPLSLFFLTPNDWMQYCIPPNETLMKLIVSFFWPGPLNIVAPKKNGHYDYMLNGSDTIALGCIKNKTWRSFMNYYGKPIALTSANKSGCNLSLITEEVVKEQIGYNVKYFIPSEEKIETSQSSTIILIEEKGVQILRHGDITKQMLYSVIGKEGYHVRETN